MGKVTHFVNRFNWTLLPVVLVGGGLFALGMSHIRDGLLGMQPDQTVTHITISNKGDAKAFELRGGKWESIAVPKK